MVHTQTIGDEVEHAESGTRAGIERAAAQARRQLSRAEDTGEEAGAVTAIPITPATRRSLRAFVNMTEETGQTPTLDELGKRTGVSKVTVHEHLRACAELGIVQRDRQRKRNYKLAPGIVVDALGSAYRTTASVRRPFDVARRIKAYIASLKMANPTTHPLWGLAAALENESLGVAPATNEGDHT